MSASVYPASLAAKGAGWRFQAWCFECGDGLNTKTRKQAQDWQTAHNERVHS